MKEVAVVVKLKRNKDCVVVFDLRRLSISLLADIADATYLKE